MERQGRQLSALGRDTEALRCYAQALATNPQHVAAWFNKATIRGGSERLAQGNQKLSQIHSVCITAVRETIATAHKRLRKLESKDSFFRFFEFDSVNGIVQRCTFSSGCGVE